MKYFLIKSNFLSILVSIKLEHDYDTHYGKKLI